MEGGDLAAELFKTPRWGDRPRAIDRKVVDRLSRLVWRASILAAKME
jgi:hypothetical protein